MESALRVSALRKSFGDVPVLNGIDLEATTGQVLAIVGPSGSGKSTFLRCINGLETFESGEIDIVGHRLTPSSGAGRRERRAQTSRLLEVRRNVGMVFQSFHLFPHMSAIENITMAPVLVLGQGRKEALENGHRLLTQMGLADRAEAMPGELSGGQQQRVAIARALAMNPKLLLLDEITSALDPELVGEVLDAVRALADNGQTMVMVTHQLEFAHEVCDVLIVMDGGRIIESGPPTRILSDPGHERTKRFIARMAKASSLRVDLGTSQERA